MARGWSEFEVEKTHRRLLRHAPQGAGGARASARPSIVEPARLLDGRSDGAIEYKHENISAVLIELGYPYIEGYKPRCNYQQLLFDAVSSKAQHGLPTRAFGAPGRRCFGGAQWRRATCCPGKSLFLPSTTGPDAVESSRSAPPYRGRGLPSTTSNARHGIGRSVAWVSEFALAFEKARLHASRTCTLRPTGRARGRHAWGRTRIRHPLVRARWRGTADRGEDDSVRQADTVLRQSERTACVPRSGRATTTCIASSLTGSGLVSSCLTVLSTGCARSVLCSTSLASAEYERRSSAIAG